MDLDKLPPNERIHEIARRAGAERSLYIGEMIGEAIATAWAFARSITARLVHTSARLTHSH